MVITWMILQVLQEELQALQPSRSWHPFLYLYYQVYFAKDIQTTQLDSCLDDKVRLGSQTGIKSTQLESEEKEFLCLKEDKWNELRYDIF